MKKLLIIATLLTTACQPILWGKISPKFGNGQQVQTVENKYRVTIVGTACDTQVKYERFQRCRYEVKFPLTGHRTMMFDESELEAIPE